MVSLSNSMMIGINDTRTIIMLSTVPASLALMHCENFWKSRKALLNLRARNELKPECTTPWQTDTTQTSIVKSKLQLRTKQFKQSTDLSTLSPKVTGVWSSSYNRYCLSKPGHSADAAWDLCQECNLIKLSCNTEESPHPSSPVLAVVLVRGIRNATAFLGPICELFWQTSMSAVTFLVLKKQWSSTGKYLSLARRLWLQLLARFKSMPRMHWSKVNLRNLGSSS